MKSLPQQNVDSDIWVPEYLTPSWVCLPNNQPVLAVIQPGETALEVLSTTCKVRLLLASLPENIHCMSLQMLNILFNRVVTNFITGMSLIKTLFVHREELRIP